MAQRDEWGRPLYSGKNDGVYWSREWDDEHGDDDPGPDDDDVECDDWGC